MKQIGSREAETGLKPGFPSLTAVGLPLAREKKTGATGSDGCARGLVPVVSTATVPTPPRVAMASAIPIVAIAMMPVILFEVTRRDVHPRPAHGRRRNVNWRWCAIHRRTGHHHRWSDHDWRCADRRGRRGHHDWRVINGRTAERDADGKVGAGLGGERHSHPDDSDSDQCSSFHSCKVGRNVQGKLQEGEMMKSSFVMKHLARKGGQIE